MLTIALYEPEIPPNTGALMRLAANTGAELALIEPLGFELTDTRLKRAGLDYRDLATTTVHPNYAAFQGSVAGRRTLAFSSRGETRYDTIEYRADDVLLFGPESSGLPDEILASFPATHRIHIPMRPNSRSINLANSASIALYEAWRQLGFS
ncbi:MAG: tRNA (cytidine(34)-2'-O)-methyltransferase [Gammaproteobacteria bacterium]|nr:tRNA (cytidine(34)-2'-O)-methyltransferase [Gammaproteobacteria bacterium]